MWLLPSLPPLPLVEDFLPTLQKRVPPEDERETHTRQREQRLYKPESSGFQKHPQQRFPDANKEKKPRHATEVQTQNFSIIFLITEKRERGRETKSTQNSNKNDEKSEREAEAGKSLLLLLLLLP
jgi:hypothetical protein